MNKQLLYSDLFIYTIQRPIAPAISVVIPTRNEAPNLRHVLPYIPTSVSEVVLVDGRSLDDTVVEAKKLLPSIKIIEQEGNGKGDALKTGFAACTGDIVVTLDADGSTDPKEIPRFVEVLLQGYDFAKGSRYLKGAGSADLTPLRRWGNSLLCGTVNLLFRTDFSDLCYGYNASRKHCLNHVIIDSGGFEVETLINIRMHKAKLKILEVPSFEHARIHGQSNLRTLRDGWRVLQTIVCERMRRSVKPSGQAQSEQSYQTQELLT